MATRIDELNALRAEMLRDFNKLFETELSPAHLVARALNLSCATTAVDEQIKRELEARGEEVSF